MKYFMQAFNGVTFVTFIALKMLGSAWSWWWLLLPSVPCIGELIKHLK